MISFAPAMRGSSDARAFRFLLICLSGWVAVRMVAAWDIPIPTPPEAARAPWTVPTPFSAEIQTGSAPVVLLRHKSERAAGVQTARRLAAISRSAPVANGNPPDMPTGGGGADRHSLRLALMVRFLPSPPGGAVRSAVGAPLWFPLAPAARADPGQGKPFWIRRQLSGWSLAGWVYLRDGAGSAPGTIGAASQLGGSQAGLRLGYGFGDSGRARAYARATIAVQRPEQREVAFGLAYAPLAHLPVDLAIEQRVALGSEGRTALAAMVTGGVSDVALPAGFRLDAYAQAGVVGTRRRDGFADGAIVVDRGLGPDETSPLRLGALAAGAVQPGAARVDVGPRLTLRLPDVGEGSRIALDWRQRVAGEARPESGVALTLAADF